MLPRVSLLVIGFLFLYSGLPAQNTIPATGLVEYEVLTDVLQASADPQSLNLRINSIGVTTIDSIVIRLAGINGKLSLLYAEKSGAALWLIQSAANAGRENVLAWNYSDSTVSLQIYPFTYPEPYTLTLELQLNLPENIIASENQQYSVVVEAGLPDGVFAATVTGRGNTITLNK